MAKLAIKGHSTRGKEVIEILEMLGGSNKHNYSADCDSLCFYIGKETNMIYYVWENNCYKDEDILVFTLEEFLEKYPYKVGDKVNSPCKGCIKTITSMEWDTCLNTVTYKLDNRIYTNVDQLKVFNDLQPHKEETIKEKLEQIILEIPTGYEFFGINDDNKVVLTKKQPKYPKTYEECCKILNITKYPPALVPNKSMFISRYEDFPHYYEIQKFAELIICRDAYWKIAGEQLGLDKPWEPDWENNYQKKWIINFYQGKINLTTGPNCHFILAFPTAEIRDSFKENFDDDIEFCKEFL